MRTSLTARFGGICRILFSVSCLSLLVPTQAWAVIGPCTLFPGFSLSLAYVSGDGQSGDPSAVLPQPLQVSAVYSDFCRTVALPQVAFSLVSAPPGASGTVVSPASYSQQTGYYSAGVTLGSVPGTYVIQASCVLNDPGLTRTCTNTVQFTLTARGSAQIKLALGAPHSMPSQEQAGPVPENIREVVATITVTAGNVPAGTDVSVVGSAIDLAAAGHDHFNVICAGCLPATTTQFFDFRGDVSPVTCLLNSRQCSAQMRVPLVSGTYKIVALLPDGTRSNEELFFVSVDDINLVSESILSASPDLILTGQFGALGCGTHPGIVQSRHINNHYGTNILLNDLLQIASEFRANHAGLQMRLNDMSLVSGGLMDIDNDWGTPHVSHRIGYNADIEFHAETSSGCVDLDQTQIADLRETIKRVTHKDPVCEGPSGVVQCGTTEDRFHLNHR